MRNSDEKWYRLGLTTKVEIMSEEHRKTLEKNLKKKKEKEKRTKSQVDLGILSSTHQRNTVFTESK